MYDSLLAEFAGTPFQSEGPEIPADRILAAMDDVSSKTESDLFDALEASLQRAVENAYRILELGDARAIELLDWDLRFRFAPILFQCWKAAYHVGGEQMIEEMREVVPASVKKQLGLPRYELPDDVIEALEKLFEDPSPEPLTDNPALQAVQDRIWLISGSFSADQMERFRQDLRDSIQPNPETGKVIARKELERRIQDNLNVGKVRAGTIAQTETTEAYNLARVRVALQSELVTHFRFIAIDDKRTTPICRSRNGVIVPLSEVEWYKPPLHFRCRSTISPIMSTINPEHAQMIADPNRDPNGRKLEPLMDGWRTQ